MGIKEIIDISICAEPLVIICFLIFPIHLPVGFPGGSDGKESVCSGGDLGSIPGSGRSPEEGNGYPNSSVLAWEILWTEEPGGLQYSYSKKKTYSSYFTS